MNLWLAEPRTPATLDHIFRLKTPCSTILHQQEPTQRSHLPADDHQSVKFDYQWLLSTSHRIRPSWSRFNIINTPSTPKVPSGCFARTNNAICGWQLQPTWAAEETPGGNWLVICRDLPSSHFTPSPPHLQASSTSTSTAPEATHFCVGTVCDRFSGRKLFQLIWFEMFKFSHS